MDKADHIYVGPAGWAYDDWKGTVYPADMPKSLHPLTFLARTFDTIEVNVTFYRPIDARTSSSWITKVQDNPHFKFTVKLWERYTHTRESWPSNEERRVFCEGIEPLRQSGQLGALLVQFPWSFKRTTGNRKHLAHIFETFASYPLALELRHDSWLQPALLDGLRERNIAFCNIDQPIFDQSIPPTDHVTADIAYVRLHGRNRQNWFREGASRNERYDYLYSTDDLTPWIEKLRRIRKLAKETYVITNNHFRGQAVVNAIQIQQMLSSPVD